MSNKQITEGNIWITAMVYGFKIRREYGLFGKKYLIDSFDCRRIATDYSKYREHQTDAILFMMSHKEFSDGIKIVYTTEPETLLNNTNLEETFLEVAHMSKMYVQQRSNWKPKTK